MNQEYIYANERQMKKANSPATLTSGAMGPCVAIAMYDPKTRSGYMLHEPSFFCTDLRCMIQKIKQDYGDLSRLNVFVAGNSLCSDPHVMQRDLQNNIRPYVEEVLREYFKESQLQISWAPDDHRVELFLDTSNGDFDLNSISLDELI